MAKNKYLRGGRYLDYQDRTLDLLWRVETLQSLKKHGMTGKDKYTVEGNGLFLVEIYGFLGKTGRTERRIRSLYSEGWLCSKEIKKGTKVMGEEGMVYKSFPGGRKFLYFFGGRATQYLKENYDSFQKGWLAEIPHKYRDPEVIEKIKKVEVEKEVVKIVPIKEKLNLQTEKKVKEGW